MNKKSKSIARVIAILTIACMFFTVVPPMEASAAMTDKTYVETMTVGNNAGDSVIITKTEPYTLNIQCTHSLEYAEMDVRVYALGTKEYVKVGRVRAGLGAGETWNEDFSFNYLSPGNYRLTVYKKDAYESSNLQYRSYVDRITVVIDANGVNLVDYAAVSNQNKTVRAKGSTSSYKDKALTDFKYMLFNNAGTSERRTINSSTESAYYKKISDQIVSAGDSDYTKLYKIYTYVAENLYYDNYKSSKPYDDPYNNLKHINSTSGSGYNWSGGKVAAQCDGYAGLFIALARAQDIPARMVGGNLLSSTTEAWETVGTVMNNTHCWVQAYADGRWIEIDPCRATLSTRNSDGSWTKARQLNYLFFDMKEVQMAHTHCAMEFMGTAVSSKANQTISGVSNTYTKVIGSKAFTLNAKAKTSKTYKSSNTKVVTVSTAGKVTIKGTGKATITITAKSSSKYNSATKKVTVIVKPKQVTGLKLTKAKKSFTAKWSKATGASGYQVAYTTDKNFKKNIKTTTTTSLKKTVSKLTAKKTYYVKVRAYKKASDGTKVYGSYSAKKYIKTK